MLATFTGWPSALDNCSASAVRTVSSVKTALTHTKSPIERRRIRLKTPSRTFLSMVAAKESGACLINAIVLPHTDVWRRRAHGRAGGTRRPRGSFAPLVRAELTRRCHAADARDSDH